MSSILPLLWVLAGPESPVKNLPLRTPSSVPKSLCRRSNLVSVSEYRSASSKQITRVFRYTFEGDISRFVQKAKLELSKQNGWEWSDMGRHETDIWRVTPNDRMTQAGMVIQATRFVPDKKSPTGWTPLPFDEGKGWIAVSWNEQFKSLRD